MKYATVCSGIEAPSVAWKHLGWKAQWFSEISAFPSALLAHHYPDVPNLGDMTKLLEDERSIATNIDVFLGGTPCQSFSQGGKQDGLDDPRGQLAIKFFEIINAIRPTWVVWENVPRVLSINKGRDFGALVTKLGECGYGWSYRVLDAQYFGVPQRRRRVFLVGHSSGRWQYPAAVLFERESLQWNLKKVKKKGKKTSRGITGCIDASYGSKWGSDQWVDQGFGLVEPVAKTLTTGEDWRLAPTTCNYKIERHIPWSIMPQNSGKDYKARQVDVAQTLTTGGHFQGNQGGDIIQHGLSVRRFTPVECERLQGFPDDYTRIPYKGKPSTKCPDGPRYTGIGNSIATPVLRWLGERIQLLENII